MDGRAEQKMQIPTALGTANAAERTDGRPTTACVHTEAEAEASGSGSGACQKTQQAGVALEGGVLHGSADEDAVSESSTDDQNVEDANDAELEQLVASSGDESSDTDYNPEEDMEIQGEAFCH